MQTKKKIGLVVLSFMLILTILNFAPQVDTIAAIPNAPIQNEVSLSATPLDPPPSMIAYWELNENGGTVVSDSVVPYVTGDTVRNPNWVTGIARSGLEILEGQYIDFKRPSYLYLPEVLTIEAWINLPDPGGMHTIIMNSYNSDNIQYHFGIQDGHLYFDRQTGTPGNAVTSLASIQPNQWHHVVVVMNWGLRRVWFYLDGVDDVIYPYNDEYYGPSGEVTVGADRAAGAPSFLNGLIDEVAIYNDMLDQSIIQEHYQKGLLGLGYLDEIAVNEAPVADAGGPYFADESSSIIFDAFGSTDIDGDQLEFRWDFDNDGSWDTGWSTDPSASYTWDDDYSGTVTVEVTDGEFYATATTIVTVHNVAPLVHVGTDQTVNEGDPVSFSPSVSDPGSDILTFVWDFGDGSPMVSGTLTPTHTYGDDSVYTVTLTVTDDDGGVGSDTITMTVDNVAPTADAGHDQTVNKGETISFTGGFYDPGLSDTHTFAWDFGDGSPMVSGTLTPTHTYSDDGVYTVTLTVTDDDGGVSSDTLTVIVSNVAPVAVDDVVTTDEDVPIEIYVLANDHDVDGDLIIIDSVGNPSTGTLTIVGEIIIYTPNVNFNGVDAFNYIISDGNGGTAIATVTITVNPVNDAPVAFDASFDVNEDGTLAATLPMGLDADGDFPTYELVTGPSNGELMLHSGGQFVYTPEANWFGEDSFTYYLFDGEDYSNIATVFLTVESVNDLPIAIDDEFSGDEDTALTGSLLDNDYDVEWDSLEVYSVSDPAHGLLEINVDTGMFIYTPDADWFGTDSFTYHVFDGFMFSNDATVTITLFSVNDAPIAFDASFDVYEDVSLAASLPLGFDADGGLPAFELFTGPSNGELMLHSGGQFVYTPNDDWFGIDTFTYRVFDGELYSGIAVVTLEILQDDDITGPIITITYNGFATDSDSGYWEVLVEDPESGIDSILVEIDGIFAGSYPATFAVPAPYTETFLVPNSLGDHVITVVAVNADSNNGENDQETSTLSHVVTIADDDVTGPVIELLFNGDMTDVSPGIWEIWVWDSESGVYSIHIEIDGVVVIDEVYGTFGWGTMVFDLLVPNTLGDHVITVTATNADSDNGANDQETSTLSHVVTIVDDDVTGPVIDITYFGDMTDANPGFWTFNVTDPESGVYSILVEVDGVTVGTIEGDYPVPSSSGFHSITVTAMNSDMDRPADQETTAHTVVVRIEATTLPTELVYSGDLEGQYSDPVHLEALLIDTTSGQPIPGKIVHFYLGTQYASAVTDADGVALISLVLDQEAGVYDLSVSFNGDDEYLPASNMNEFVVLKECASLTYSGLTILEVSEESMTLMATVFDDVDGYWGNLSLAYVTFTVYLSTDPLTPVYTTSPVEVQPTDIAGIGMATVEIPNLPEGDYLIVTSLLPEYNRFYCGPDSDSVVTVYEPERAHVCGVGVIVDADGHRGFFAFRVKYTCGGDLRGFLLYTYIVGDWVHLVKSRDITGFATDGNHGFFEANGTLSRYNFETHEKVCSDEEYRIRVDVFDNKKSHEKDVFQIRVFDSLGQVEYEAGFDPFGHLRKGCIVVANRRRH